MLKDDRGAHWQQGLSPQAELNMTDQALAGLMIKKPTTIEVVLITKRN